MPMSRNDRTSANSGAAAASGAGDHHRAAAPAREDVRIRERPAGRPAGIVDQVLRLLQAHPDQPGDHLALRRGQLVETGQAGRGRHGLQRGGDVAGHRAPAPAPAPARRRPRRAPRWRPSSGSRRSSRPRTTSGAPLGPRGAQRSAARHYDLASSAARIRGSTGNNRPEECTCGQGGACARRP